MRAIAETIWQQINSQGAMVPMSWGAHALKALPETAAKDFQRGGLQFQVHGALFTGHVRILLGWDDVYVVRFGKLRNGFRLIEEKTDVYADMLTEIIDSYVETPAILRDQVSEDTPAYNVTDLPVFAMTDQTETCPACGIRTEIIEERENGDQVHRCNNTDCIFGYYLLEEIPQVPEDDKTFSVEYEEFLDIDDAVKNGQAMDNWSNAVDVEVRGVEKIYEGDDDYHCEINDEKPEFYSLYVRMDWGGSYVVGDHTAVCDAKKQLAGILKKHPHLVKGPESVKDELTTLEKSHSIIMGFLETDLGEKGIMAAYDLGRYLEQHLGAGESTEEIQARIALWKTDIKDSQE